MEELYKLLGLNEVDGINKLLEALKQGKDKYKNNVIEKAKKELDPIKHDIMLPFLRNKNRKNKKRNDDKSSNNIALAYQK